MPVRDLTGQKFGRLTVARFDRLHKRYAWWICRCDCGKEKAIRGSRMIQGTTTSCGCYRNEIHAARMRATPNGITHGHTRGGKLSPTYITWLGMLHRCLNPNHEKYRFYGGRGIRVHVRWLEFEPFLADMGLRPKGKTLDRWPNKNGNYEPSNCRWATWEQQMENRNPRKGRNERKS